MELVNPYKLDITYTVYTANDGDELLTGFVFGFAGGSVTG